MTIQLDVGQSTSTASGHGGQVAFGNLITGPATICKVRVTSKLVFTPGTYTPASQVETGAYGNAIQVSINGGAHNRWDTAPSDASIWAFDSADPEGTARVFWAPNTASGNVASAISRTLQWQGQFHVSTSAQFFYVPVDVTGAANTFIAFFGWQIWYAV
jgi:hypothetical protein